MRHHKRAPSRSRQVKETLDAQSHYGSSEDDGGTIRQINQYLIKQEIGRGSFGAVHLAIDQYGNEYVSFLEAIVNLINADPPSVGCQRVFQISTSKEGTVESFAEAQPSPPNKSLGCRWRNQLSSSSHPPFE